MNIETSTMPEITLNYRSSSAERIQLKSSIEVYKHIKKIRSIFNDDTMDLHETCIVIYFNRKLESIGWIIISQGGLSGTVVDPKLVFSTALKCAASGLIMAHNHPSGNNSPSNEDITICKQIKNAAEFFNLQLVDNLIITRNEYYSFGDNGIL